MFRLIVFVLAALTAVSARAESGRAIDAVVFIATGASVQADSDERFVLERTSPHATPGAVLRERDEITRVSPCVFERRHVRSVEKDGEARVTGTRFERYDFSKFRVSRNLGGFVIIEGPPGLNCLADGRGRRDPMSVFSAQVELDCDGSIELQSLATGERYDPMLASRAVARLRAERCFGGY